METDCINLRSSDPPQSQSRSPFLGHVRRSSRASLSPSSPLSPSLLASLRCAVPRGRVTENQIGGYGHAARLGERSGAERAGPLSFSVLSQQSAREAIPRPQARSKPRGKWHRRYATNCLALCAKRLGSICMLVETGMDRMRNIRERERELELVCGWHTA